MQNTDLIIPDFYWRYVEPIYEMPLFSALEDSEKRFDDTIQGFTEEQGLYRYQPEKWTIKEVVAHVLDTERIMAYRALRFARNDQTPLAGFEEKEYAPEANANGRDFASFRNEFKNLRRSTVDLFRSFTEEMMNRTGTANSNTLSVQALGYIIAGHMVHHCNILIERYRPGLQ
ncbi:MAG TPA: DinB family protein [Cyclobacteriaceae bacterium]